MPIQPRPEFRGFLEAFPGFSFPNTEAVVGTRAFLGSMPPPPTPDASKVSISSETIPAGEDGEAELRVLWVKPAAESKGTVIVFHGGGFIIGAPEMDIPLLGYFAEHGFNVISVDYRLAPEHPFPAAFDDAERAWNYLTSSSGSKRFAVDSEKIALYGSSAGSALASGLARRLNKKGAQQPTIVVCDSMFADDRADAHASSAEGHENSKYYIWSRENMLQGIPLVFDGKEPTVEFAPLRSTSKADFEGLAPHYICSCELDALADHGPLYAQKLKEAGVSVELHVWRAAFHAFSSLAPDSVLSKTLYAEFVRVISDAFDE